MSFFQHGSTMTTAHSDIRHLPDIPDTPPALNIRGVRVLAWAAFWLLNILYLFACMQRNGIPGAIFNDLQSDLNLLGSQVTRVSSLYVYTYAGFQIFAGILIDRFGGKKTGIFGGICLAIGLSLFSTAQSAGMLYAGRIVAAVGQSFLYLCVVKICHLLFPPKQFGAIIALSMAVGFAGALLGTLPAQLMSQWFGWRYVFLTVGMIFLLTAVAMFFILSKLHERQRTTSTVTLRSVANLFNSTDRYSFVTFQFWTFPVYFVLQSVLGQKFIQDYLGYSGTLAATFTMILTFGSIITCLISAPIMKLLGDRRMPMVYLSAALPLLIVIVMAFGIKMNFPPWVFLASLSLVSFSQISAASTSALMSELTDTRTIAFSAAVRNCFPYVGSGIVSWICGLILDKFAVQADDSGVIHYPGDAYFWILLLMAVFGLIGLLHILLIPETRGKHIFADPYEKKHQ